MIIKNPIEFQMIMNVKLPLVLESVMQKLLIKLQDIIEENVYSYQLTGDWNNRTYEFLNSWTTSIPIKMGNYFESQIDNQAFQFTWANDKDMWSHGNSFQPIESNDDFNEIIDNRQGDSNFGFPSLQRHYWMEFLLWIDVNLENTFREECLKQGIPIEYATIFIM